MTTDDLRRARVTDWFSCIDINRNGRLEWTDLQRVVDDMASYLGWLPDTPFYQRLLEGQRGFWDTLSATCDTADDGSIGLDGFQRLFDTLADDIARNDGRVPAWALGHVITLLRALDLDGDGTFTIDEYALYLRSIESSANPVDAFMTLDADGDGRLTLDELEARYVEWVTSETPDTPGNVLVTGRLPDGTNAGSARAD